MKLFEGRDQPLALRVAQASFGLTMLTVAALFAVFMLLALAEIPGNTRKVNENAGSVLAEAIVTDINFVLGDLRALSRSSLVWTSLSDSTGREVYLKPFLETRNQGAAEAGVVLADYRGRLVLGKPAEGVSPSDVERVAMLAIERRAPQVAVIDAAGRPMLLAAEPVLYPYTKDAIGALVNGIDLASEFGRRSKGLGPELGAHLMHRGRMLSEHGDPSAPHFMLVETKLKLLHGVNDGPLSVEVYSAVNPWVMPVAKRLLAGGLLAVLMGLVAWHLARKLGQRMTARLQMLASHCESGTAAAMPQDPGRDEIGVLSRALAQAMRSYEEVNHDLERRVVERTQQLMASEELLRGAIDAVNEGFAIFDQQDRMVYCNRKYRLAFPSLTDMLRPGAGFPDLLHEWVRRNRSEYTAQDNAAWVERRLAAYRKGGTWTAQEETGRWVQGIERRTPTGHTVSFRVDITDLVEARQRAEAASEAKTRFLSTMSHELRTPLNGVLGMAQLLQGPEVSEAERLEFAQIIEQSGQGLLNVVNDILDLSKIEAGKLELHWAEQDPSQLVQDVALLFREQARSKGLQLQAHWDGVPGRRFRLDPQRLRQILINLLGNAVKFTEQGSVDLQGRELPAGADTAQLDSNEAMLEFSVRDTGVGIPADKLALLFQPFSQVDSSDTRRYGGTGLGLSIVEWLAGLLGGSAGVQSEPGKGSHFWVRIRAQVVSTAGEEPVAVAAVRQPVQRVGRGGRVLVVEDHPINQTLTQAMLDKVGLDSVVAGDGQQAVDMFARGERFDLVLMDLQMPVLDGLQATREIRRLEARRPGELHLPIIALTANLQPGVQESCIAAGLDDVLYKPVDLERLRETLARWLEHRQAVAT
ncbi:MAG: ATP-binding protein [Burkholderiaceae bacterium]